MVAQKLLINGLKYIEDIFEFDESFVTVYDKENNEVYFLEV